MPANSPMPNSSTNTCNVRISLCAVDGSAVTVKYRHGPDRDQIMQFRFKGKVILREQITSQPQDLNYAQAYTSIGPSAIFFD